MHKNNLQDTFKNFSKCWIKDREGIKRRESHPKLRAKNDIDLIQDLMKLYLKNNGLCR